MNDSFFPFLFYMFKLQIILYILTFLGVRAFQVSWARLLSSKDLFLFFIKHSYNFTLIVRR